MRLRAIRLAPPLFGFLLAFAAASPPAAAAEATVLVPIVLSAPGGSGSYFVSELTLANRGGGTATVELTYTPAFGSGAGAVEERLDPGRQIVIADAIVYLRRMGLPIPEGVACGGTLVARFTGLASSGDAAAVARTTTAVPGGRAGLAYTGVTAGLTKRSYLCGLRQNAVDRSNVALIHAGPPGSGEIRLRVTVSPSVSRGETVTLPAVALQPGGFHQLSGVLVGAGFESGYVSVERVGGKAPYYAYAVINDQVTSDGSFVPPVVDDFFVYGGQTLTLPAVVDIGGFQTEVILTSTGPAADLTLTFASDTLSTLDGTTKTTLHLNMTEQVVIPSFVSWMRERGAPGLGPPGTPHAGALFVTGTYFQDFIVGARTWIPGGGGRYGLFYRGTTERETFTGSVWLFGLRQDAENRTNLALVNTGEMNSSASTFRIEVFDGETGRSAGTIASFPVAAKRWRQIDRVLQAAAPNVRQGYARVTRTSGTNPFLAYAVVNDGASPGDRSGDGAFLPPERECAFDVPADPRTYGPSGGTESAYIQTASACTFTAESSVSWMRITLGASSSGNSQVQWAIDANPAAEPRTGSITVAGTRIPVTQLGNAPGLYDGTWSGATSKGLPVSFRIEKNEVKEPTIGIDTLVGGSCHVQGTFVLARSPAVVVPNGTFEASFAAVLSGGTATVEVKATFSLTGSATGSYRVPFARTSGAQCTTVNAPWETFTASRR